MVSRNSDLIAGSDHSEPLHAKEISMRSILIAGLAFIFLAGGAASSAKAQAPSVDEIINHYLKISPGN